MRLGIERSASLIGVTTTMETRLATSLNDPDALAIAEEEAAKAYGRAAKSARTRTEYARDWAHFAAWCAERGVGSLPAAAPTVARYLGTLGGELKIASIRRRVVAISQQHKERGFDSPTAHKLVREVVTGIARTHGSVQTQKAAITTDILGTLLKALDRESLRGQRDRAILLLGFSGAAFGARSARRRRPGLRRSRLGRDGTVFEDGSARPGPPSRGAVCAEQCRALPGNGRSGMAAGRGDH
jgi:hypothetical protein